MTTRNIDIPITGKTWQIPSNISLKDHNGGWNINICDQNAIDKKAGNPLGIIFSICAKSAEDLGKQIENGLKIAGAKPTNTYN